jgi:hypothetical protein
MGNQGGGSTISRSEAARINNAISSSPITTGAPSEAEATKLAKTLFRGAVKKLAKSEK